MAVHAPELWRVPDIGQQQQWREHQRTEHCERALAAAAAEQGDRHERRHHDDPELGQRTGEGGYYGH